MRVDVALRLLNRHSTLQHRYDADVAGRARRLLESKRHVELGALGELEPRRHDADDRSGTIVDDHAAADDCRGRRRSAAARDRA